jgi:hypothetical protein
MIDSHTHEQVCFSDAIFSFIIIHKSYGFAFSSLYFHTICDDI